MSKTKGASILLIVIIAFPLLSVYTMPLAHAQGISELDRLLKDFFCTCGCNYVLATCETQMSCDVATSMKAELRGMLAKGNSRDQIVEAMTSKYGNTVLATPRTTGFNTFLWWYPVAGGLAGLVAVVILVRRRSDVKWRVDPDAVPALSEDELLQQLDIDQGAAETSIERKYDDLLKEKITGKKSEEIKEEKPQPRHEDGQKGAEKKKDYDAILKEKTRTKKSNS
ncbi:MAG: cytochrome c-type biogenesis protein CcmH [Thaumarchaeota archaeon]|nr:cytochrome c-type biogenesis protein CcmH [Nitrososphaerota archaeon]MCL5317838.1 cytochrome c-type biogenesis protein CcmH [Nitrososphaerota archaeon]